MCTVVELRIIVVCVLIHIVEILCVMNVVLLPLSNLFSSETYTYCLPIMAMTIQALPPRRKDSALSPKNTSVKMYR